MTKVLDVSQILQYNFAVIWRRHLLENGTASNVIERAMHHYDHHCLHRFASIKKSAKSSKLKNYGKHKFFLIEKDLIPRRQCCAESGAAGYCEMYRRRRPAASCAGYRFRRPSKLIVFLPIYARSVVQSCCVSSRLKSVWFLTN